MKIIPIVSVALAATCLAATDSQAKYCDDETDLVYYGYRYYNPSAGRWLSRDPMGEPGGQNLFVFVFNNPTGFVDALGMDALTYTSEGRYYVNGHHPFGYSSTGNESGVQNTPNAYFSHSVTENNCPRGICNSDGTGDSSSFVEASVKNSGNCTLTVN